MADHEVLPPVSFSGTPGNETLEILERKLLSAEDDSRQLVDKLSHMGFRHADILHRQPLGGNTDNTATMAASHAHVPDPDVLYANYEALISRVCKIESVLQTLKMNMTRAQAERDLSRKEKIATNEKLLLTTDSYDKTVAKLNRDLAHSRKQCQEAYSAKQEAQNNLKRLQEALTETSASRSEVSSELEGLRVGKQKLQRRCQELKEELARESSLRESLEESHRTLLGRIQDLENIVQAERQEVKTLSSNCLGLKRELTESRDSGKRDSDQRNQLEKQLQQLHQQYEQQGTNTKNLEEDKKLLILEMNKMKKQYEQLNGHLDQMSQILHKTKDTQSQLELENKQLQETMKTVTAHNAELIAQYEQQLETGRTEKSGREQGELMAEELKLQLRQQTQEKTQAVKKCAQLEEELRSLRETLGSEVKQLQDRDSELNSQLTTLAQQLETATHDRNKALKEKHSLLNEVNQAVEGMTEERSQLSSQLQTAQSQLQEQLHSQTQLEQEHRQLLERMSVFQEQQDVEMHIKQTLADMVEQKNKLSYDKGRLHNQVEQLQQEMQGLSQAQTELLQLRKSHSTLETKYNKVSSELAALKMHSQQQELQLQQSVKCGQRKEEDFSLAIRARDEAVKEAQRLQVRLQALEHRESSKLQGLQQNVADVRHDNKQIAGTLESVMTSHTSLQLTVEALQLELGSKDSQISQLKNERTELEHRIHQQTKELDNVHNKLCSIQTYETTEIEPLRDMLQKSKEDNCKMAASMETVLKSCQQLEATVQCLEDQLQKKTHLLEKLHTARDEDDERHKEELVTYQDRLDNFRQQLSKERSKSLKKTNKEVAEVRKQLEELLSKNGELSRTNSDLRHKTTELEYALKETKEKVSTQKAHIEHLSKIRKKQEETIESLQVVSGHLADLEAARNQYVTKNKEQARTIENFTSQVCSLQEEITALAQTQMNTSLMLEQQEQDLLKERAHRDNWRYKYKEVKKREQLLEQLRQQTEDKLLEANNESLQISGSLYDAQDWFKSKFDTLQTELIKSRKSKSELERENLETRKLLKEERRRAEDTALRAQAMIKASRETISRLADCAELTQKQTTQQMHKMKAELATERQHVQLSERKLNSIKESSLRHTEELARQLDLLKSQSYQYDNSS